MNTVIRARGWHGPHPGRRLLLVTLAALVSLQCSNPASPSPQTVMFDFDFAGGAEGWVAGFADYPPGQEAFYELVADHRPLPPSLAARSALYISGNNHSDDLFMFYKRRVAGLRADARYEAQVDVVIATDVPAGCGGVGGSPGESVFVKAGIGRSEPTVAVDASGSVRFVNFDKGNQATGGTDALVLGTVSNSRPCEIQNGEIVRHWELKSLHTPAPLEFRTDEQGAAWILVGTDSGFEATTSLYYTRIVATVRPSS